MSRPHWSEAHSYVSEAVHKVDPTEKEERLKDAALTRSNDILFLNSNVVGAPLVAGVPSHYSVK